MDVPLENWQPTEAFKNLKSQLKQTETKIKYVHYDTAQYM